MDSMDYMQTILALIFVLALIGVLTVVARRFGFGYRRASSGGGRRLSIVEVMPVDAKRRLVLFRRDDHEHLVLLGATSELLIEGPIAAAADDFAGTLKAATAPPETSVEPAS
jgi:flagellar protein FliO/FliZ